MPPKGGTGTTFAERQRDTAALNQKILEFFQHMDRKGITEPNQEELQALLQ